MTTNLEEFSDEDLDQLERRRIRRMLSEYDRGHWLLGAAVKAVMVAGALAAAAAAIKSFLLTGVVK